MTTINKLSALDAVSAGDLFAVYDASSGDARKAAVSLLTTYLQTALTFASKFTTQIAALSATGQTVEVTDNGGPIWLIIKPAAAYAAATVQLPAVANCVDGQEVVIHCTNDITALTVDGNGATVFGWSGGFNAGERHTLRFSSADSTWYGDVDVP